MRTRERIARRALEPMNEGGHCVVSTDDVTASLGMSPGDLHDPFRGKAETVQGLADHTGRGAR